MVCNLVRSAIKELVLVIMSCVTCVDTAVCLDDNTNTQAKNGTYVL